MNLPKNISPCPIAEAIFEIRFKPQIPEDAVFGVIYSNLNEKYAKVESLPILDLPEKIRKNDQRLKYKPYHKLDFKNYILQIGPKVLSLAVKKDYPGWDSFYDEIKWILERVKRSKIIDKIERHSLRYINIFEDDIFKKIDLKVSLENQKFPTEETYFRTKLVDEEVLTILQIANDASYGTRKNLSLIDLDVVSIKPKQDFIDKNKEILNSLHQKEKENFFRLLSDNFLKSLNPKY